MRAITVGAAVLALAAPPRAPSGTTEPLARPLLVTVDDLPIGGAGYDSPEERARITRGLLAALDRHGIKAVGLVTWGNLRSDADLGLLDLWLKGGHELGNHSVRHLSYTATDAEAYVSGLTLLVLRPRGDGWAIVQDASM